jgi:RecB family exonuclease
VPLTLVTGPANSAKAGEVLGAYADARRRGALLVVPTWDDADLYGRELASQGAALGGKVLTFAGLAREVARRAGYDAPLLSVLQRERVLGHALARVRLGELAESAASPGFAGAALDLISELERSLITPQRFARAAKGDVASIYTAYARELDKLGRVDAELYAWRALDALRAAPGRWQSTPVFVYGFDDLTPLERDAIETLSRIAGAEVTVSLTYEAGRSALAARAEAVEELRPLADRSVELPALDTYYEHPALHLLERRLFEGAEERADPGEAVRLLEAGGERAEVELVAAEVLELLEAGIPAEEIAVVYRSAGPIAALIERVFCAFRIPVAPSRQVPFGHTALGRGLLGLARCALDPDADASELVAYLRTPGVLKHIEQVDGLEATIMRERLRSAAEARARSNLKLGEIDSLREARKAAKELERQARRLLALDRRGTARVLDAGEALDARAVAVLTQSLAELDELGAAPRGPELVELLEGLEVPVPRVRAGSVVVAEPLQIRARRFRAVFVCGLQDGAFPLRGAPDPFLSDERRRELAASSGLRLRLREDSLARERYLFYSCVSRATERVVLSYRSSDEEGNVELPSPFIADVAELFVPAWRENRRRRLLADVVWPLEEAPTARERARAEAVGLPSGGAERRWRLTPAALAHARHREIVSAGALEKYADCPVKWLVESELQPRPLHPDPDPLVRGAVIHDLLEELLGRLGRPLSAESLPAANQILDELLSRPAPAIARGRPESVRRAALRSIEADLRRYLAHEAASGGEWRTEALELLFGFGEGEASLPALELDGVRVRGRIDRVDVDGEGHAIVRDYKTGSVRQEWPAARWSEDRQLQVALYMLAVRDLLGLDSIAGLYQPLGGDDLRPRGVFVAGTGVSAPVLANDARSPEELEGVLEDARQRAIAIAGSLRSGELEPCPETCSRDGCKYPGICRSSA